MFPACSVSTGHREMLYISKVRNTRYAVVASEPL